MRTAWGLAAAAVGVLHAGAQTQTEYKQADTNFYLRGEVFSADPGAPIVAPDAATNIGGTYLIATKGQAPRFVYLPETHAWIEPITPPSEPASLNIAPAAMQVREPQGSVQVAPASAPAAFQDVDAGTTLTNGSTLRTGDSGSVAVLFGGVDSVRLAPNTLATVQMTLAGGVREVEVDVRSGMVFSKVGARPGEKQRYAVHTPFGDATAHGTDYVTAVYPARVDVWVAQGTVELKAPDGTRQVTVSTGHEPLKVMRFPAAADPAKAMVESAESLTALLNFIPMANRKLAALDQRRSRGAELTPREKDYLGRIRQVVALIRLANVNAAPTPSPVVQVDTNPPAAPRAQLVALPPLAPAMEPAKPVVKPTKTHALAKAGPASTPVVKTKAVALVKPKAVMPKEPKTGSKPALAKAGTEKTGSPTTAAVPAHPKPIAAFAKTNKTMNIAKTTTVHTKPSVAVAKTPSGQDKPVPGDHYLRAQPVNPADLVQSPAVETAPPPSTSPPAVGRASVEADPNSLGAPLSPLRPMLAPRPASPAASDPIDSSASAKSAAYSAP